jgi:hypothetical protein
MFLFHLLLNMLFIASILAVLGYCAGIVLRDVERNEQTVRGLAALAAVVLSLGLQASGISIARGLVHEMSYHSGGADTARVAVSLVLLAFGIIGGRYALRAPEHNSNVAMRLSAFVVMLLASFLIGVYFAGLHRNGFGLGSAALPDAAFVLGLVVYVVFNINPNGADPHAPEQRHGHRAP